MLFFSSEYSVTLANGDLRQTKKELLIEGRVGRVTQSLLKKLKRITLKNQTLFVIFFCFK